MDPANETFGLKSGKKMPENQKLDSKPIEEVWREAPQTTHAIGPITFSFIVAGPSPRLKITPWREVPPIDFLSGLKKKSRPASH
jgi:hypothetical protein